jgi:(1->4)-alpha-D-glucan 1-alpha-D-glucosylmutase
MIPLRATARLQFHKDFTFDDAAAVIGYYARLGVSHLYASPMLAARAGSTHGYDIVDPTRINPELGGEEALRRLVARLREEGMGLIADIVPNHMGGGRENPWWQHVLEWGPESQYARWFDIDWESPDPALRGKVLAPFLGKPYGEALLAGELKLGFDPGSGKIFVEYYSNRFPLSPASCAHVLRTAGAPYLEPVITAFELSAREEQLSVRQASTDAAFLLLREMGGTAEGAASMEAALMRFTPDIEGGLDALHELLERQHYRLTWWRNAAEEINWRRFFEVSDLAGVRVEEDDVFEATHALIFRLYAEGLIDGVRVDHVDGLAHPHGYCRKLRRRLTELAKQRPPELSSMRPYIVVEKILGADEQLRADWGVDGTTGYEFMDQVGALMHDPAGAAPLGALWSQLTGDAAGFDEQVRSARRQLLAQNFVGEFEAAARVLHAIARADLRTRDIALPALRRALTELLVHFPVYRTYAGEDGRDAIDQREFERASRQAMQALRPADRPVLDMIGAWLGGTAPASLERADLKDLCQRAITRFQQLTPPLAAKSVEDTAFYRYGRLLSRNEVGADPGQFSLGVDEFHRKNMERARQFPQSLLATATHDHKRGEDARMRIAVLSEMPEQWEQTVRRWRDMNQPLRAADAGFPESAAPSAADELMLYQMLTGAWPLDLDETDAAGLRAFADRIDQWQTKALREAKRASSWVLPNESYEKACRDFLYAALDPKPENAFLKELAAWVRLIAPAGAINSLAQTVLRLTSPGVPDLYQGTDLWDFSLVDPDNRRPVDHAARSQALSAAPAVIGETGDWRSGSLKQQLIHHALALRRQNAELFAKGEYEALAVEGEHAQRVVAFVRRHGGKAAITLAMRLSVPVMEEGRPALRRGAMKDTAVILPEDLRSPWTDVLTGARAESGDGRLRLDDVFGVLPVALLTRAGSD